MFGSPLVGAVGAPLVTPGGSGPAFDASLRTSLIPSRGGTPNFARATIAKVFDHEGWLRDVKIDGARFYGARRVENLQSPSYLNSNTSKSALAAFLSTGHSDPFGASTAALWRFPSGSSLYLKHTQYVNFGAAGWTGRQSIWLKAAPGHGGKKMHLYNESVSGSFSQRGDLLITLTEEWKRYTTASVSSTATGMDDTLYVFNGDNATDLDVYIAGNQIEEVSGASATAPSEHVSKNVLSAPYHGANVDGVKYFDTTNGNTVDGNGVVTEAAGAAISASTLWGYYSEGQRTNYALYSRDLTNAAWVKTNATAALNQKGIDGRANSASSLLATGANATAAQAITRASAQRVSGWYIKRLIGTGTVEISQDNGATWTAVTGLINGSTYTRVSTAAQTLANPTLVIRIATSGDKIAVDYGQHEEAGFLSSPILTTTVAMTRDAEVFTNSHTLLADKGTISMAWTPQHGPSGTVFLWGSYVDANNYTALLHDGTNLIFRRRVGGSNIDATIAHAFVAGTTYRVAGRWGTATDVFLNGTKGTSAAAGSAQLGTTMQIGANGNGADQPFATLKNVKGWKTELSDVAIAALP